MFLQTLKPALLATLAERTNDLRRRHALWRAFRETRAELERMSDRDLADIGISRLQIRDIAREAVYGR